MRQRLILSCTVFVLVLAMTGASALAAERISFWMMNYGDRNDQVKLINELSAEFKAETGIEVDFDIVNWDNSARALLLAASGGEAPDVGDLYWLWSHAQIGHGEYGPMPLGKGVEFVPLDEFQDAQMADVYWQGKLYGVPWRVDIRPLAYRTDFFADAGIAEPPSTWDDLVQVGKKLTVVHGDGRVEHYGVALWNDQQGPMPWIWQAGGEVMDEEGVKATIDTPQVREAMQFVRDLIWKHEIASPQHISPTFDHEAEFLASRAAILPMAGRGLKNTIQNSAPQLIGKYAGAIPLMHKKRYGYSGAGMFAPFYGTRNLEASAKWVAFLGRADVQVRLGTVLGQVPGNRVAMQDAAFTQDPWSANVIESLKYAHTSQHASPAWSQMQSRGPGGVFYDLWYESVSNKASIDSIVKKAQTKAQQLMDRARR